MRQKGWNQADLWQHPGLKAVSVSKALKWLENLPGEYHDKVGRGEGLIPGKGAYLICDFPAEQRKELCEQFIAGHMTVEVLEAMPEAEGPWPERKAGQGDHPGRHGLRLPQGDAESAPPSADAG